MYEGALTSVKLGVGESVEFAVMDRVHQGSGLSLFIIISIKSVFITHTIYS